MVDISIFVYKTCSTCRKALKFLEQNSVEFCVKDIIDTPPSLSELKIMLNQEGGNLKKLFNTSGLVYREMGLSQKLPNMSTEEALKLLSKNGKLIKRPFLLNKSSQKGIVGFKESEYQSLCD